MSEEKIVIVNWCISSWARPSGLASHSFPYERAHERDTSDVFPSELYPTDSVGTADNRSVPVRLMNTSNEVCELHKGQRVADFSQ